MKIKLRFLILSIFIFSFISFYLCSSNLEDIDFKCVGLYKDGQNKEFLVPIRDKLDIASEDLIASYERIIQCVRINCPDMDIVTLERAVEYYRISTPIVQVDIKVAKAFEIIKKDLSINTDIELRVLSRPMYALLKKQETSDASGFFYPCSPRVVYIIYDILKCHPIIIIQTIVHELEHFRQYWNFPHSFEWSVKNEEKLGKKEFYCALEYGADQRAAEYFQCNKTIYLLSCTANYRFKDPKGYFASWDYLPFKFKTFFSSSKGFKDWPNYSDDILDYLPNSGVYWNRSNIAGAIILAIYAMGIATVIYEDINSKRYYRYY